MGNGESKEVICTTHGHELRQENAGRRRGTGPRGIKRRKKWVNCNSITNKIYLKKDSPSTNGARTGYPHAKKNLSRHRPYISHKNYLINISQT